MSVKYGYGGGILRVDLSSGRITTVSTEEYADRFIGGRGIAAKIYWDEVPPDIHPFHSENRLIFANGPMAGFPGIAGSRWEICGKSPQTSPERFCSANLGGRWGAELKFAGYDALVVYGKADRPVYLLVKDSTVALKDASHLWGKSTFKTRDLLKNELGKSAKIVTTGPAGESMVSMATVLTDDDASGTSGFGAVMGSKRLKAIVVMGSKKPVSANPDKLKALVKHARELKKSCKVWHAAQRPKTGWTPAPMPGFGDYIPENGKPMKRLMCYGCMPTSDCARATYTASNGAKGKWLCVQMELYYERVIEKYGELTEVAFHASRLLEEYGLDASALMTLIEWLDRCYRAGILTEEFTGLPLSELGSYEFIETLIRKISYRDGFGDVLAGGVYHAAEVVGGDASRMITDYASKAGQVMAYGPRIYIATGLIYAMEQRQVDPQMHAITWPTNAWREWVSGQEGAFVTGDVIRAIGKRFWGSEMAADFSTYEGKALAAKMIQDRHYARESLVLCDFVWPIMYTNSTADKVGDPTLESRLFAAVTGNDVDEEGLYRVGERIFNLQRAILVREGHRGREGDQLQEFHYTVPIESDIANPDCIVPGENGAVFSRKG
ncbi:MAG: hypothetical protein JRH15_21845, partial [Deltaproteobacteria bacterium]|nr:hypothetical protein [Deltaproteobacteria bacterium]